MNAWRPRVWRRLSSTSSTRLDVEELQPSAEAVTTPAEEARPADGTAVAAPAASSPEGVAGPRVDSPPSPSVHTEPTPQEARSLLTRAAQCYLRADLPEEAARCYREAGVPAQAAALWERAVQYDEAARDYARAGMHDRAAWLLVHWLDNPRQARAELASWTSRNAQSTIVRELILARCAVADGQVDPRAVLAVERAVDHLACSSSGDYSPDVEVLAVAVADALRRPDLSALVFAAAVRSGQQPAVGRWQEWSLRTLHTPLVLPEAWNRQGEREEAA